MNELPTRDELIRRAVARRRAHRVRGLRDLGEWVTYIRPDYSRPDHFPGLLEAFDKIQQGIPQFILLEAPPRHAKTDTIFAGASRNLVTFPDRLVAYCTYSSDFARDQSRKAVTFALRGGVRLGEPVDDVGFDGSTSARFWQTPQGGGFLAVGRGGGIKGKGVHLLIVDDPFKDRDEAESAAVSQRVYEWWTGTLFDRLEPGGSVIITHQRWNDQDLIARITKRTEELAKQDKPRKPWVQLTYPAIDTHGEPLWEQRYSAADLEEIRGEVGEYNWHCTPGETPILMADWTTKPISEVRPGDAIIGFRRGNKDARAKIIVTQVLRTFQKTAKVNKLRMESGRIVRCTEDHCWYTGRKEGAEATATRVGRKEYAPASIGTRLALVCPVNEECSLEETLKWHYLAGIVDGEGAVSYKTLSIAQSEAKNKRVCDRIRDTLVALGIDFHENRTRGRSVVNFQIRQPRDFCRRLMRFACPAKSDQLLTRILEQPHMFIREWDRVSGIDAGKRKEPVFALETGTGNYIAWGYASSNSQFMQRPQPRGARLFVRPQEYRAPLPLTGQQLVISVDPAATENTRADPTAVGIGAISGRGDDRVLKLRRVWTFRVEVPELVDFLLVLQLCLGQQGHPSVPMVFEAIGAFKSVPQTLRRINHDLRILSVTPDKSKFVRAQPAAAATKRGQILLPNRDDLPDHELGDLAGVYERHADDQRWLNTPERIRELLWEADSQRWLDTFVDELTRFTGADGERDDQTDMVVHMWDKAESSFTSWEDKPKFRPRVMRGGGF